MMEWTSAALAWAAAAVAGTLFVAFDATRTPDPKRPPAPLTLAALVLGPFGLVLYLLSGRGRPESPLNQGLQFVGAAVPGILAATAAARLLDLPLAVSGLLLGVGAFASAQAIARGPAGTNALRAAALLSGAIAVLAYVQPQDVRAWDLLSALLWATLSLALAMGTIVVIAVEAAVARVLARRAAQPARLRREEAVILTILLVATGFVAASPAATMRATGDAVQAACGPGMAGMEGMDGMGEGMGGMDGMFGMGGMMMDLPTPHGCDDGASGMAGMAGMAGMGDMGMDMRPAETEGALRAPADARGGIPLTGVLGADGVRMYDLRAGLLRWNILPDVTVDAYAYNDQLPGPLLMLTPKESVNLRVTNALPENTTVHLHGLQIPNDMDGVPYLEQRPINPGETFEYRFVVPDTPGTFFYHTHFAADRQQSLGLYGGLIIGDGTPDTRFAADVPVLIGEWAVMGGRTYAAMNQMGMMPNFFTLNGKSYPETETIRVKVGDDVRLRVIGSGQFIHPMHLHGQPFTITATDGNPVPEGARLLKDTVLVGPGERYDLEFTARALGTWLFHCHINDHLTNNGEETEGAGGLTMRIVVET